MCDSAGTNDPTLSGGLGCEDVTGVVCDSAGTNEPTPSGGLGCEDVIWGVGVVRFGIPHWVAGPNDAT